MNLLFPLTRQHLLLPHDGADEVPDEAARVAALAGRDLPLLRRVSSQVLACKMQGTPLEELAFHIQIRQSVAALANCGSSQLPPAPPPPWSGTALQMREECHTRSTTGRCA